MHSMLRVNTRTGAASREAVPEDYARYGGRGLLARILIREVPPTCEPLGRHNKLIFACGLLGDTLVTTAGKMSVGGKSPLTYGAKEANTGGEVGKALARCGVRALVLEDAPSGVPPCRILRVTHEACELIPAPELSHKPVSETFAALRARFGKGAAVACIGPAGEMMLAGAGVAVTDARDIQVRYAARGGLGAVMGSKGVKALVVEEDGAPEPAFHDPEGLREAAKDFARVLLADPKAENRHMYGTPAILAMANEIGILPTRNFSAGSFEGAGALCGETVREVIKARGGEGRSGTPCLRGCVIQCSNVFPDTSGKKLCASIQYENIVLLGPNCGIGNLDDIAELNHLCNEVGMDAIETGAAIGVAMEAGVLPFGDAEGAKRLVREIGEGTHLGRILGNGAVTAGRCLGVRRVPTVKGQAIPAYDPRSLKGNGVTYVTSPQGADHTAGNAFETARIISPTGKDGHVEWSRRLQLRAAILDSLGICLFTRPAFIKDPTFFTRLIFSRHGLTMTPEDVLAMGAEVLDMERDFNERSGASERFHDIPEFMRDEPLPPRNSVFDLTLPEMREIWNAGIPDKVF